MNQQRIAAPELSPKLTWLNVAQAQTLAGHRGKFVILHFWAYGRAESLQVIADLTQLARNYPEDITVIGIHTPKFPREREMSGLQDAIGRHYLRYPVAQDIGFETWKSYGIKTWDSLVLIDPEGNVLGMMRGAGRRRKLDDIIRDTVKKAEDAGTMNPARVVLDMKYPRTGLLKFPGHVLAAEKKLFVADSGNNRVLEVQKNGRVSRVFGSGAAGWLDAYEREAAFNNPQGMAMVEGWLYVSDFGNNVIRKINLVSGEVLTAAGNGKMGAVPGLLSKDPLQCPLGGPWDICYDGEQAKLIIALAGINQIAQLAVTLNTIEILAGSGQAAIGDGSSTDAAFAQPMAVAVGEEMERMLFVADANASALRAVTLRTGNTRTLLGKGLYETGDQDGKTSDALMQHPMDLDWDAKRKALWVLDSFNDKLKFVSPANKTVSSTRLSYALKEPGGLSIDGDTLWIANTNGHEVVRVDLNSGAAEAFEVFEVEAF